ncbi:MAG: methyltransferase [Deltaproteobacteria bacterium]|nr:methyltransferase [Deltaproteobacteria bacterium]
MASSPLDGSENVPPLIAMHRLLGGHWVSQAVSIAAELGLADYLANGPASSDELAEAVGAHPGALYRLLRALGTLGVVSEISPHRFELTPVGTYLRTGIPGSLRSVALLVNQLDWAAWGDALYSIRTGKTAFDHVHGVGPFEYFERHPEVGAIFDQAMTEFVSENGAAAVEAYDFGRFATIVDVGGGHGALLTAILEKNPSSRGIVFDLPRVIEGTRPKIAASKVAERCECVAGDFFASVPAGGDAYVLASIVHDWDEERALTILKNCRRAMGEVGKLLLIEMVIPPEDARFFGKWLDLQMLVCVGGQERTAEEYAAWLERAGFRLTRVVRTTTPSSVVEAEPIR